MAGLLNNILIALTVRANAVQTKKITAGLNSTSMALRGLQRQSRLASLSTAGLFSRFGMFMGAGTMLYGLQRTISSYTEFEKRLGAIHSRFYAITNDEAKANEEFEYIRKVSRDTANDMMALSDTYSIFYASAKRSLGQDGARGVFETWTKIARVLHLNEESMGRVMYALREMSSKGQLYSQDLKMQLGTHVPDAVNIATEAIKNMNIAGVKTVDEFQKKTKTDKTLMPRFLIEFSKVAGSRFASPSAVERAMTQPDALQQQILTKFQDFVIEFSKSGGNKVLSNALRQINSFLNKFPLQGLAKTLGWSINFFTEHLRTIILWLTIIAFKNSTFFSLISKHGFIKGFIGRFWGKGAYKTFLKNGIKGILGSFFKSLFSKAFFTTILSQLPFVGWILEIVLWFPEIVSILKWIARKFGRGADEKGHLGYFAKEMGFNDFASFQNLMKALSAKNIQNNTDLRRQLGYYGRSDLARYMNVGIDGKIYLQIYGQSIENATVLSSPPDSGQGLKSKAFSGLGKYFHPSKTSNNTPVSVRFN